jgi:hypothetical protein
MLQLWCWDFVMLMLSDVGEEGDLGEEERQG